MSAGVQVETDPAGGYRNRMVMSITDDDPEPRLSVFPTVAVAFELKGLHREAAVTFVSRPKAKGHVLLCCHRRTDFFYLQGSISQGRKGADLSPLTIHVHVHRGAGGDL